MNMKSTYFVAGLLLMIIQSSWQSPLQETEEKTRSFKASQAEPLDDSRQLNEVKRHSQGTFTSDYSKFLDTRRAQDFVQWLMNTKRSGQQGPEEKEKESLLDQLSSNGLARRHADYERHADGTYTSDISSYLEGQAAKDFIAWLMNGRGRRDFSEGGAGTVEEVGRRHADGTFTSDYNKLLDDLATQEFLKWLINQKVTQRDVLGEYQ
ncbi:pro-glucagon isoform X1 [Pogona vitticeps]|uniref:Pro-glucagon isoform X1 n=1 Tax=Pogona vitticeps TaxID=103695 RepID=A0A6J0U071_9SAUR|nr:glucagon isoform X1 [Pogona vitticeps]